MSLDLQADADAIFLNCGFEENITYTVSGGTPKTIKAIVSRNAVKDDTAGKVSSRSVEVEISISTNATTGVDVVTVNEDTVLVAKRIGETPTTMTVGGVPVCDSGMWRLRLR